MSSSSLDPFSSEKTDKIDKLLLAYETLENIGQGVVIGRFSSNDNSHKILFQNEQADHFLNTDLLPNIIRPTLRINRKESGVFAIQRSGKAISLEYALFLIPPLSDDTSFVFSCILTDRTNEEEEKRKKERKLKFQSTLNNINASISDLRNGPAILRRILLMLWKTMEAENVVYMGKKGIIFPDEFGEGEQIEKDWVQFFKIGNPYIKEQIPFSKIQSLFEEKNPHILHWEKQDDQADLYFPIYFGNLWSGYVFFSNIKSYWEEENDDLYKLKFLLESYIDRYQTQKQLLIFESIYYQTSEAVLISTYSKETIDIKIVFANPSFIKLTGYSLTELLGQKVTLLVGKCDLVIIEEFKEIIQRGESVGKEIIGYTKSGKPFDCLINISVIRDPSGNITHTLTILRDITEKKKQDTEMARRLRFEIGVAAASQILNQPNTDYETLSQALNQLLIFTEMESVFLLKHEWNDKNENLFVQMLEENKSHTYLGYRSLFIEESWENHNLERWVKLLFDGKIVSGKMESFSEKEQWYFERGVSFLLLFPIVIKGEFFGVLGWEKSNTQFDFDEEDILLYRTVTTWIGHYLERKINAEELNKYQSHLEDLVKERTSDLMRAKDLAESANKLKSDFLARMSHELRTPLNSIIGFTQLIQIPESDSLGKKYLDYIHGSGNGLLKIINGILDLSKIEAGKMPIQIAQVNLQETVKSVIGMMIPLANENNIQIRISEGDIDIQKIRTDSQKLTQILVNILSNAVKYSPSDSIVTVSYKTSENHFEVTVTDQGNGISKNQQEMLFESFTRLPNVDKSEIQGTGLGLTITKKFVELLGGQIEVQSELGKGSSFKVILPNTK
ncbi:PAS domain-containing sensor histidine kinase [Leptospira ilyithenensis]|uniref:histidine kinase n=1 Tax=Leptospira ilyithenensis TaxID=2484901 RepID=A0A4R9LN91_9LEPT|nr:ATP-binding protein [Leptospira ilyithenensis]TGN08187.1 PAS domain-containing protein [Leptospira ilyithenensis]